MNLSQVLNSIISRLEDNKTLSSNFLLDEKIDLRIADAYFQKKLKSEVNRISPSSKKVIEPTHKEERKVLIPIPSTEVKPSFIPILLTTNWHTATELNTLESLINHCEQCQLSTTRKNFVFGRGNPNADILVIGEAPGAEEDERGEPFVGRSGKLLTDILKAIEFEREDVYIANIIKCRPPENRRPTANEVTQCEPFLHKQIELIKPKFILALGLTAMESLLKEKFKMADIRGKLIKYRDVVLIPTYHPAALLRNPSLKKETWQDVKLLKSLYQKFKDNTLFLEDKDFIIK